jgi:hypothetical protein
LRTVTTTYSRRTISKNLNDLVNRLYAKYGKDGRSIEWPAQYPIESEHAGHTVYWGDGYIDTGEYLLQFRQHGNTYAGYLELYSYDQKLMERVKQDFPEDFPNKLVTKEGV